MLNNITKTVEYTANKVTGHSPFELKLRKVDRTKYPHVGKRPAVRALEATRAVRKSSSGVDRWLDRFNSRIPAKINPLEDTYSCVPDCLSYCKLTGQTVLDYKYER